MGSNRTIPERTSELAASFIRNMVACLVKDELLREAIVDQVDLVSFETLAYAEVCGFHVSVNKASVVDVLEQLYCLNSYHQGRLH